MRVPPARRKPTYAVGSVDNALRLLQMLRDVGKVRGKDAAAELNISPSTVHRHMSMLVYRGFAVQDDSRTYLPGPAIGIEAVSFDWTRRFQSLVKPFLEDLRDQLDETVYFMIRTGTTVRFILTVEASHRTRAGDRHGFVIPAHSSAAGRAILAAMTPAAVAGLYRKPFSSEPVEGMTQEAIDRLQQELSRVRSRGYELSVEEVETGIVSLAVPIRNADATAAISIAGPVSRLERFTRKDTIDTLLQTRNRIEAESERTTHDGDSTVPDLVSHPPEPEPLTLTGTDSRA